LRITLKTISLILPSAALYCAVCTVLTAWLYRMGPVEDFLHWHSWGAAIEMAAIMTTLSAPWWIWPSISRKQLSLWRIGIGTTVLSALSTGCYIFFIFQLGPDHPLLTVFGYSATTLFREDVGIVYAGIVAPTMAVLFGIISCLMIGVLGNGKPRHSVISNP